MRKKLILAVALLLVVVLLVSAGSAFLNHQHKSAVQKTSDTFASDIVSGKAADSFSILTPATQKEITQPLWGLQVAKLTAFFQGVSPDPVSNILSAGSATYVYSLPGKDGNYTLTINLVHDTVSKTWRVESYTNKLQA